MSIVFKESAYKHGCNAADIVHAFRNAIRIFPVDSLMKMAIGPTLSGGLLEVGYSDDNETYTIFHAMPAREKFLKNMRPRKEGGHNA